MGHKALVFMGIINEREVWDTACFVKFGPYVE